MNAIDFLASSLKRKDDKPNQDLATNIINSKKDEWVKELVDNLHHKDKNIQSDCIKVLYEIGYRGAPDLIAPYSKEFIEILKSRNNRMVWGAMFAINTIVMQKPEEIYNKLSDIMKAIDNGSVITIDNGISILSQLAAIKKYKATTFPLLFEQLKKCPAKQLPMYAEKAEIAINLDNREQFVDLIETRMSEMTRDTQKKRLLRVLEKSAERSS